MTNEQFTIQHTFLALPLIFYVLGMKKAEWGLDSVTIGVNETNLPGFQDNFAGMMPDMFTWFQTESAVPRITCNSKGNALEFSRNTGSFYLQFSLNYYRHMNVFIF